MGAVVAGAGICQSWECGKRNDRAELAAVLAACKKQKAKLIIAKLDRLSRNLAFIATLMDSGVEPTKGTPNAARQFAA
jgi:hypothetical protein